MEAGLASGVAGRKGEERVVHIFSAFPPTSQYHIIWLKRLLFLCIVDLDLLMGEVGFIGVDVNMLTHLICTQQVTE